MTETLTAPADTALERPLSSHDAYRRDGGISTERVSPEDLAPVPHGRDAGDAFDAIVNSWIVNAFTAKAAEVYWALKQVGRNILALHPDAGFSYEGTYNDEKGTARVLDFILPHVSGGVRRLTLEVHDSRKITSASCIVLPEDEDGQQVGEPGDLEAGGAATTAFLKNLWGVYLPGYKMGMHAPAA